MANKTVILGGGISGLTLAWSLSEKGNDCVVLEAESFVGGLAASVEINGYYLDFGPHSFFSHDEKIRNLVLNDLFDGKMPEIPRTVKLYFDGRYLDYPLTPKSVLIQMGLRSGVKTLFSFAVEKLSFWKSFSKHKEDTVESWAVRTFGRHLFNRFFKPYTEQFWKTSSDQLSSVAIPSYKKLSFLYTLVWIFKRKVGGSSLIDREKLPTYYPVKGFGEIPQRVADKVEEHGGKIHLGARVKKLEKNAEGKLVTHYTMNGRDLSLTSDTIVSTVPINQLVRMLSPTPPEEIQELTKKIDFIGLILVCAFTKKVNTLGCAYMYMLNRPYNRITDLHFFSPQTSPEGSNILMFEVTTMEGSDVWNRSDKELSDWCLDHFVEDGFIKKSDIDGFHVIRAPKAYPIYRRGFANDLSKLRDYIKAFDSQLFTLGRSGEFLYMDSDICMSKAFGLSSKLLKSQKAHSKETRLVKDPTPLAADNTFTVEPPEALEIN